MPKLSAVRLTKKVCDGASADVWDAELRGFGLRVSPGGTKAFVVQYTAHSGRRTKCKVGRFPALTVDEARVLARKMLSDVDHGLDPSGAAKKRREMPTVADLLIYYENVHAPARRLDAQTVKDAKAVIRLYTPDWFLRRKITEIGRDTVQALVAEALRTGVEREDARIAASRAANDAAIAAGRTPLRLRKRAAQPGVAQTNRLIAVLSRLFELPPARDNDVPNPVNFADQLRQDERLRNFTEEEVTRLLTACELYAASGDNMARDAADAVRLLLFTGARLQEVLSASWSQFDLERGLWIKPSAHTKQSKLHAVGFGVDSPAAVLLRDLRKRHPNSNFLFPGLPEESDEGEPKERPRADLKRPWKQISKLAGLPDDDRIHDIRRTTASFMLDDGASIPTVGAALGHTQSSTTMRYAKMRPLVQAQALDRATNRMTRER